MADKVNPEELEWAFDYDPSDPMLGLSGRDLSGPKVSRRTVLRLLAATGALSAASILAACGPAAAPEPTAAPAEEKAAEAATGVPEPTMAPEPTAVPEAAGGGELTAGWSNTPEITTLDPAQINQVLQFQVASMVLSGLTHISADLVAEPDLAESWEVSDDGKEWIFHLRQGVTWHNGDPFTADDVVFTYNRSKDPDQSIHSAVLSNVTGAEKIDDHTVKFILEAPQASFLTKTTERASGRALTIVNQRALEEMGPEEYGLMPVGTGPYKVVDHQLGQGVTLEKFEDYYDPDRPLLDKITYIPVSEPEPLAAAIEAGDIQIIGGNPPAAELIDRFVANPDLTVSEIPGPGFQALWMNPWRDPFKVPDFDKPIEELKQEPGFMVRLAIAKAIDREDLINRALFGRGVPALGSINAAMRYFFDTEINETSEQRFDVEEAQRLLAEAGFPDGEGFPTLKLMVTPGGKREGEIIVDILKKNLNIDVELDLKDWTVLVEKNNTMDFDMLRIGSGGDYDPDDGLVDWMMTTSKFNGPDRPADMPFGTHSIAEVDELIEQERVETDPEKRKGLVLKANQLTSDKVVAGFLYHPTDILVYRNEVNFPDVSRIPGLVDLDRTTIEE